MKILAPIAVVMVSIAVVLHLYFFVPTLAYVVKWHTLAPQPATIELFQERDAQNLAREAEIRKRIHGLSRHQWVERWRGQRDLAMQQEKTQSDLRWKKILL